MIFTLKDYSISGIDKFMSRRGELKGIEESEEAKFYEIIFSNINGVRRSETLTTFRQSIMIKNSSPDRLSRLPDKTVNQKFL